MPESVLVRFRRVIASHLSLVLGEPFSEEGIFPIVQQNTGGHRKAEHSVFSVVIRRLLTTVPAGHNLQDDAIERCIQLSPEVQTFIKSARRSKDMLLFDPVPLQMIQLTIQNVYQEMSGRGRNETMEATTLARGKRSRDDDKAVVVINGSKIQEEESGYNCLRRIVLTGFAGRFLQRFMGSSSSNNSSEYHGFVKVVTEMSSSSTDPRIRELYRDLDVVADPLESRNKLETEPFVDKIKKVLQSKKQDLKLQKDEQGEWTIDLTSQQLGKPKLFSRSKNAIPKEEEEKEEKKEEGETGLEVMGEPTLVIKTVLSLVIQFSEYQEIDRYIWMVPDSRRQFAEQVLYLVELFFNDKDNGDDESSGFDVDSNRNRIGRKGRGSNSWVKSIEPFYFGAASGADIWKSQSDLEEGIRGIIEFTDTKMKEIIVENRGRPGRGTEYGDGNGNEDDEDEEDGVQVLEPEELARMARILSTSALAFASAGGKRIRRLNIDMSRIMDGKGNSGVFLQYVQSRLCGIERKSKVKFNLSADLLPVQGYSEALNLSLVIAEWQDILTNLEENLDPYILVSHLFRLAGEIGQANRVLRVKDMDVKIAEARWMLFWAAKQVLEQGLWLLGLEVIERM